MCILSMMYKTNNSVLFWNSIIHLPYVFVHLYQKILNFWLLLSLLSDLDLLSISSLFGSLCYLNIKGCALVTDIGISKLLCKCPNIKSLILSYTSFGRNSVLALCSDNMTSAVSSGDCDHRKSGTMAYHLHQLQINGCKG